MSYKVIAFTYLNLRFKNHKKYIFKFKFMISLNFNFLKISKMIKK